MFWIVVLVMSLAVVAATALPIIRSLGEGDKPSGLRVLSVFLLAAAPVAAALTYLEIGRPESLSAEFDVVAESATASTAPDLQSMSPEDRVAAIESMVAGLAARLQEDPSDVEGWRMLARSYGVMNRAQESADAYREVVTRDDEAGTEDWRNFALALLAVGADGSNSVSSEAVSALTELLTINAEDPLALFYLGMAARERGNGAEAVDYWQRLLAVLPADAPILPQVETLIADAAGEDG